MRRLAGASLLVLLGLGAALAQETEPKPRPAVYEDVWKLFKEQFYDTRLHGQDWDAALEKFRALAEQARSQEEVHEAATLLLGELEASHSQLIEPDVYAHHYRGEGKGDLSPMFGMQLTVAPLPPPLAADGGVGQGFFVDKLLEGGAALAAGVRRGDRVLSVDGVPVEQARLRPVPYDAGLGGARSYRLPTRAVGDRVLLELERRPGVGGRYEVQLASRPYNQVEACRNSRRVETRSGFKVGYIHLYHFLSEDMNRLLADFLYDGLREADAVVVDLRGRGGLPTLVDQALELFDPGRPGGPLWDRPAVILVDKDTRSAKELFAFLWQRRRLGPVVGTRSAGAVLGSEFEKLDDGSYVLVPKADFRATSGGIQLEGRGVTPDTPVKPRLAYANGLDPVVEAGFRRAAEECWRNDRRGQKSGWY